MTAKAHGHSADGKAGPLGALPALSGIPCFHLPMENTEVAVYREFARQTRERAEATRYPEIKRALLKIAREYECLADYVERLGPKA
jgi:hypothetical protein